ncbi:MAG: hypothetical protein HC818_02975 [Synechococcaceae cyanobacterium RM1_1_27]|nr:hypothetical protein [Synechococcaceae cyanobacterium RM1_1_27]
MGDETAPTLDSAAEIATEIEDSLSLDDLFQGDLSRSAQDEETNATEDPFADFEVTDQQGADRSEDTLASASLDDLFADLSLLEQHETEGSLVSDDLTNFLAESSSDEIGDAPDLWISDIDLKDAAIESSTHESTLDVSEEVQSDDSMFAGLDDLFGEASTDEISGEPSLGISEEVQSDDSMFAGIEDLFGDPRLDDSFVENAITEEWEPSGEDTESSHLLADLDDLFSDETTAEEQVSNASEDSGIPVPGLNLETAETDSLSSDFNELDALFADDLMGGFGGETQAPTAESDNAAAERETNAFVSNFEQDLDNLWNEDEDFNQANGNWGRR